MIKNIRDPISCPYEKYQQLQRGSVSPGAAPSIDLIYTQAKEDPSQAILLADVLVKVHGFTLPQAFEFIRKYYKTPG